MKCEMMIREEIQEKGMKMSAVSRKSGIEYWKIQTSLSGKRELRADEYLDLCRVLQLDPMDAVRETQKTRGWGDETA